MDMTVTEEKISRPTLNISGVSKSFGNTEVLSDFNLAVPKEALVTVLGPSGSGKSTILGLIVGSTKPDKGRIFFGERDVTDLPIHLRGVGMVFQRYTLFPNRTVFQNVSFPLEVRGRPASEIRARVRKVLDIVGLSVLENRYPAQISGGQAQRVALARALVFEPSILLMDEPLGALDRNLRKLLQGEIRRIQQEFSIPTVYVTHDQEEALSMSDMIVLLRGGRMMASGTPAQMYESPPDSWSAQFLGDANIFAVKSWSRDGADGATCVTASGMQIRARVHERLGDSEPAAVLIRPERCRLGGALADAHSGFTGKVTKQEYLGQYRRIHIRHPDNENFAVHRSTELGGVTVGDEIACSWDPGAALLIKHEDAARTK